jgi:hypothetical protein
VTQPSEARRFFGCPVLAPGEGGAFALSLKSWLRVLLISAALLIPCFWHATIQAGDLASHTYNAWLAQLIERGQAPGLWVAHPWNNVLFDLALLHLGNLFGLRAAERIAVCAAVLIFFWGAFAFVCSVAKRIAWTSLPFLAMLAYGWTFSQGFFNYYISVGLAFWALALIQSSQARKRQWKHGAWPLLILVPIIVPVIGAAIGMASVMGLAFLLAVAVYMAIAKRLSVWGELLLFGAAMTLLLALHWYFARHAHSLFIPGSFAAYLTQFNGADQLALYGRRYRVVSYLFLAVTGCAVLADYFGECKDRGETAAYRLPLQLYGIFLIAGFLLPWVIFLPQYSAPLGMITERLSLITAVMVCCLLGMAKPTRWHFAASAATAALFFFFLYQDTGTLDRMEQQASRLERSLPRGSRVVSSLASPPGSRILIHHLVDRSCIGYCFSYGNYEPSSSAFRVRAEPGNPYVIADWQASEAIRTGKYQRQHQDPPLSEIYTCGSDSAELCLRTLPQRDY